MKCFRLGCPNEASVFPLVSFLSLAHPLYLRSEVEVPLFICFEHATRDVSQYLDDNGWQWAYLVFTLKPAERAAIDRHSLQVRYMPVHDV